MITREVATALRSQADHAMELDAIVERRNGMMSIFVGTQRVHTRIENGRLEPTLPTHEGQQIRAFQRLPASTNAA
jgi:hypothetical protein